MLLLILFVLFYIVLQDSSIKVSSEKLARSYSSDITEANKILLNKEIKLTGKVKSFFQFEGKNSLLELESGDDVLKIYCIIMNKENESKAESLTKGTTITIVGKCIGINPPSMNKFPNAIYIEAEQIK
jgi:hypothetical protein